MTTTSPPPPTPKPGAPLSERPFAFLVGTTSCARNIGATLGSANYSYFFAVKELAPVLERFGTWQLVDQPETRLPFLAAKAEAQGYRPVHLSVHPPHDAYLSPALPNILLPFWEFPDIPNRDFVHDIRTNWLRVCNAADLILAPCTFTERSLRAVGIRRPVAMMPIPLSPAYFDAPEWDPKAVHEFHYRHEIWDGSDLGTPEGAESPAGPTSPKGLGPRAVLRRARAGYQGHVRRWLSHEAQEKLGQAKGLAKAKVLRRPPPPPPERPRVPASTLRLQGLTYTSIFNASDPRKNQHDMLSAFLLAFQDRPDVTLVLKLNTSPTREVHEFNHLRHAYRGMGIRHACRVAVVADFLDEAGMKALFEASTYYINTSRAEGACMPLQQAMAAGRPVLAPTHTSMADYIDASVGFPLRGHAEPTCWPHDPERRIETTWARMVWSDIRDQYRASAALAHDDPTAYFEKARAARRRVAGYAGAPVVAEALAHALAMLPDRARADGRAA